ncbi:MAG: serine hydrolase domain-containing protein [Bacteroidota bacterium]
MNQSIYASLMFLFVFNFLYAQEGKKVNLPKEEVIKSWMEEANVPNMAIASIESGQLGEFRILGKLPDGSEAQEDAIFDVASLTKSITTYICLKYVSKGKWDLDEPLATYFTDPDVKDDPRSKRLTSRHVLSHQSGFPNWRYMDEEKKLRFGFDPGTKTQYSGEGFEYLRKALEAKFEKPMEKMAKEMLFTPMGMKNSFLIWDEGVDDALLVGAHDKEGKAYTYEKVTQANAADNLLTSVADFVKFGRGILKAEGLSEEVYQEMTTAQSEVREGINFSLGWIFMDNLAEGEYALFNAGSDQGVNAIILLLPKSQRGLIAFTNGDQGRGLVMRLIGASLDLGGDILGRF